LKRREGRPWTPIIGRDSHRSKAPPATAACAKSRQTRNSGAYVFSIKEAGPNEDVGTAQGRGDLTSFPPKNPQFKTQDTPSETAMSRATQDAGIETSSWITL
jgi:hypothetical protein